ncbi:MAG: sigma-54-dependent Fis family transcriptional regulator [Nitrospirae bacterium]|nr:sigma-54-dependent Fis family transcriptional regulator [Nitrospirota bacterium]
MEIDSHAKILVVEDDQAMQETCRQALGKVGYETVGATSPREAEPILLKEDIDLVVTDLKMPHGGGQEVLRTARKISPHLPVILITAYPSVQSAVDMFKRGLADYLTKPFTVDQLRQSVRAALQTGHARDRSELLRQVGPSDWEAPGLVGASARARALLAEIRRVAAAEAHVLVSGEAGAGREAVARAIHRFSARSVGPFVVLHCASIEDFPAAESRKGGWAGALEQASRGSLFLDEVGDLPREFQPKLLGLGVARGGKIAGSTDARVLAATFKDLREEVRAGRFREDAYYHLAGLDIHVPPLRERLEDVPAIAVAILDRMPGRGESPEIAGFAEEALERLSTYAWPGNLRELENTIRKAVARAEGPLIKAEDLDLGGSLSAASKKGATEKASPRDLAVGEYERKYITSALSDHDGNISHTAIALGVHRTTLQRLMKKHGITGSGR